MRVLSATSSGPSRPRSCAGPRRRQGPSSTRSLHLDSGCGRRTQPLREAKQPRLRAGRALLRPLTEPDPMGAKMQVGMALTPNSLARRKPGVQIPSPPPHNSPGRRPGGHLLWAGVLSELLPGQQTGSNLKRNGQPLLEARQGCACLFPRAIAETPLPHGRSYTLAECESTLELEPQAGVKIPSFVRGEAAGGHGLSASTAPSSRLHASPNASD